MIEHSPGCISMTATDGSCDCGIVDFNDYVAPLVGEPMRCGECARLRLLVGACIAELNQYDPSEARRVRAELERTSVLQAEGPES